ncbi:MAG: sulfotransferase domain-containing protein [Chloroflexota bacterium]
MKAFFARLLGRQNSSTKITIVSGLPRSGTSLMMRMLEAGGISVVSDSIRTADTDNPNGYYEFERVKKLPSGDVEWVSDAQGKVVKIISMLLKHLPPSYQYRIIFMERAMEEVLASQQKMLTHRNESTDNLSDEEMRLLYGKHLQDVKSWLAEQDNMDLIYVNYNVLLKEAVSIIEQLNQFCDKSLQTDSMLAAIDPTLYRNRA